MLVARSRIAISWRSHRESEEQDSTRLDETCLNTQYILCFRGAKSSEIVRGLLLCKTTLDQHLMGSERNGHQVTLLLVGAGPIARFTS